MKCKNDETDYQMKRHVIEALFDDQTWRVDPTTKKGGLETLVQSMFEEDYMEMMLGEGDPHLKCTKKELADLLKEYVILGMGAYDSIEEKDGPSE